MPWPWETDSSEDQGISVSMKKYGKTAAQVTLRRNNQRGVVVIPQTVHEDRMKQNLDVFDFTLSQEDMEEIKTMDIGHSKIVNHFAPQRGTMPQLW